MHDKREEEKFAVVGNGSILSHYKRYCDVKTGLKVVESE